MNQHGYAKRSVEVRLRLESPLGSAAPMAVDLDECETCGALVVDTVRHDLWQHGKGETPSKGFAVSESVLKYQPGLPFASHSTRIQG